MTHLNGPFNYPLNIACFNTCNNDPISVGLTVKPQQASTMAGNYESTINTSTGVITLPDRQCLLIGSITYVSNSTANHVRYQWFDVSNSQYLGSIGQVRGFDAAQEAAGVVNEIANDEEAICIAQNINIKLVITAFTGSLNSGAMLLDAGIENYAIYAGKTKLTIYEF